MKTPRLLTVLLGKAALAGLLFWWFTRISERLATVMRTSLQEKPLRCVAAATTIVMSTGK